MKLIGLTGGIGSGKTTVSEYLIQLGYKVLDADQVAREILAPGGEPLKRLVEALGKDILLSDGSLNRKKVADMVFSDAHNKMILEKITHPEIIKILLERATALSDHRLVFLDAALLYETGLDKFTDLVWLVDAEDDLRIKRVIGRDGSSREHILLRIMNQQSREAKKERADKIIDNSGDRDFLYAQVDGLLNEIREKYGL
jgi:dephospho-CoA kinase